MMDNDSPLLNWSKDILEAYGALNLPSLYDVVLANEKIAVEVRKQNKELKNVTLKVEEIHETLVRIHEQREENEEFSSEQLKREIEYLKQSHDQEKLQDEKVLIAMMDAMINLTQAIGSTTQELLSTIPKTQGFFNKKPVWREKAETLLLSLNDGMIMVRNKLLSQLADRGIELITAFQGEMFSPNLHRVVEKVAGDSPGKISHLIRLGYQRNGEVIRFADVCVYNKT